MSEHWSDEFEHELITDDNREAFKTAASKFATQDDMSVGYMELQKTAGKPFKLPESLDKLPDDDTRADFTSKTHKLLGIETAANVEALAALDIKAGLPEGVAVDENLGSMIKKFAVDKKIPIGTVKEFINFYNTDFRNYALRGKLDAATKTNEGLIAHFGSEAKVKEQSELLRRAIKNSGITPEEYEQVGEVMADTILTKDPVAARVMLKLLAPLAASSSTEPPGSGTSPVAAKDPDEGSKTYQALGWSKK